MQQKLNSYKVCEEGDLTIILYYIEVCPAANHFEGKYVNEVNFPLQGRCLQLINNIFVYNVNCSL
jgi:hypothetical protein